MEIIKRKIDIKKENFAEKEVQFAINDWGHFTIRVFDKDNEKEDQVIVFPKETTRRLISFCKKIPEWF